MKISSSEKNLSVMQSNSISPVLIIAFFVSSSILLFAQAPELNVKWGKEFSAPRRSSLTDILAMIKREFML
jgi:hypothetical protein